MVSPKSWEDVNAELEKWKDITPSVSAMTAIFKSVQMWGHPPHDTDIQLLLRHTSQLFAEFDPETLATIYYWCCKTGSGDAAFLSQLAQHVVQDRVLTSFPPKHMVLMIYGTGWLVRHRRSNPRTEIPTANASDLFSGAEVFVDKVARELASPQIIVRLKEQDLSNTLYTFGLLKYGVNEVLYPLLSLIEKPSFLPRFLEQELANMLLGMASLRLKSHPTVAILASEVVEQERLRMFKEPELCSIFYSLATLDYANSDALGILLREAIRSGRMPGYREHNLSNLLYALDKLGVKDERVWRLLLKEITLPDRLPKFEAHHLANILYAIGRCDYRNVEAMHLITKEICKENRIEKYSTREFSLMMYGMSRTGYKDLSVLRAISQELSKPGRLMEKGLAPKSLSGLLLSFATLRYRDPDLIQRYFMEVLYKSNMAEMDPELLSQYIFSLGKFRMPFTGPIEEVITELTESSEKLSALAHRGLGMLIYGMGQMGPDVVRYMKPIIDLLNEGIGKVERFPVQDLAMLVYSFGQMRLEDPNLIDRILHTFTRPDRINKATSQHLSNLMYGLGLLRYPLKEMHLEMIEGELGRDSRVKSFTSQELANLIFSIGMLNIDHRPAIQRAIEKLTAEGVLPERLAQFQEMELNCFLTGLGHLNYREPSIVVPLLEEITHPARLSRLKEKEIASVMHVIAQLGMCPDELCEKLLNEARKPERLEKYDMTSVVMMVYSLGRLQNQNYPEAIHAFSQKILESPIATKLNEQHLSNFLFGIAHARYDAPDVLKLIFNEITKHHRLARFHCNELLNVMKSVLTLRGRGVQVEGLEHVARIFAIEMTAISRTPRYTPSQLTHVLQILSVLKNKNIATVFPILKELAKADKLHQLTSIDISRAVFALGPMAFVNRALHPKLALAVKPILKQAVLGNGGPENMNCHSITELIVGLSMLGLHDTYVLDNLSNEIIKPARLRSFRAWHLSRLFYAIGQLRYNNVELLRSLASELSRPDRSQRLDYRHWSNILSAVLMLKFKDEEFAKVIEKQIHTPESDQNKSQYM